MGNLACGTNHINVLSTTSFLNIWIAVPTIRKDNQRKRSESRVVVNQFFSKWAVGFSGCDGRNPHGKIWLCGIEWGGPGFDNLSTAISESVIEPPEGCQNQSENTKFQFNLKAMKLIAAMQGLSVTRYKEIVNQSPFPFHANSNFFKINLFPIAFPKDRSELWTNSCDQATGFSTKKSYQDWCRLNRFPAMKGWVERYVPEIVICVSSGYRDDFFIAFAGANQDTPINSVEVLNGKKLQWVLSNQARTIVAVIPFLGGVHGLNSNKLLESFGIEIGRLHRSHVDKSNAA